MKTDWPTGYEEWFALPTAIKDCMNAAVRSVGVGFTPSNGLNDPTVYGATLLFRTIQSACVAFELAQAAHLIEANIIARSCLENTQWLRCLKEKGIEFVSSIENDGTRANATIAELLLGIVDQDIEPGIKAALEEAAARKVKSPLIKPGEIITDDQGRIEYAIFRMLSNSYAHPSKQSLSLYLMRGESDGVELTMAPDASPASLLWSMFAAGAAAISAIGLWLGTFPDAEQSRFHEDGLAATLARLSDRLRELARKNGLNGAAL